MILSHEHKFIYIKTYKTGSTSIEAALSAVCGPRDVVTEASEQLRGVRQKPAQNYRIEHPEKPRRPVWKKLLGRPERHYHPSVGYYEHMPAWRVRAYAGEDVWKRYFKFSFERNPWDRQVSWYHYKTKSKSEAARPSFDAFNSDRRRAFVENWSLYTAEDAIILDFVGRYEALESDFGKVLGEIGLTNQVTLPRANVSSRRTGGYRDAFTDASRTLVAEWYRPEIRHFGYEF
ncbi:MAG: sulfotransferase family 2 domain-containing protein [Hyphomicrobiaceae bacterium]|nr:sulfotransferase family 2 domain-containing protein [Hyphomicrobiaceae bacterium]